MVLQSFGIMETLNSFSQGLFRAVLISLETLTFPLFPITDIIFLNCIAVMVLMVIMTFSLLRDFLKKYVVKSKNTAQKLSFIKQ